MSSFSDLVPFLLSLWGPGLETGLDQLKRVSGLSIREGIPGNLGSLGIPVL